MENNLIQKANELSDKLVKYVQKDTDASKYIGIEKTFEKLGMDHSADTFRSHRIRATPFNGTELVDLLKASNEVQSELISQIDSPEYRITAVKLQNKIDNVEAVFKAAPEAVKIMMENMPVSRGGAVPHIYKQSVCDKIIHYFAEKRAEHLKNKTEESHNKPNSLMIDLKEARTEAKAAYEKLEKSTSNLNEAFRARFEDRCNSTQE